MKILFKFPSRERPTNFFRGVESITKNVLNTTDYRIYATLDEEDHKMNNDEVKTWMCSINNLEYNFGVSKSKIDACNRDMDKITTEYNWDILVLMSDDMVWHSKGFDEVIRNDMFQAHPDLDGVIHYPDGNREDLITLSIMGRKYYERFHYLYHPLYKSVYCDDEFTAVSKLLGKYAYFNTKLFNHLHPAYGASHMDNLYKKNESSEMHEHDRNNFNQRKQINFNINEAVYTNTNN